MKPFTILTLGAALLMLALTACTSVDDGDRLTRAAIQYGTVKVMRHQELTRGAVLAHTSAVRGAIAHEPGVTVALLLARTRTATRLVELPPEDQILLGELLAMIEEHLVDVDLGDEAQRLRVLTVLDWVDTAARML